MRAAPCLLTPTAAAAALLLTTGCTTTSSTFVEQHSAEGIRTVSVSLDSGTFSYQGARSTAFLVEGDSWGQASNPDRAAERQAGNTWSVALGGDTLWLDAGSTAGLAGVDFHVTGPASMNTQITIGSGRAILSDVAGWADITADSIDITNLQGGAMLLARSGDIDATIFPQPGSTVRLEALSGDVALALPWGGSYDIQVWGDVESSMWIDDLGFGWSAAAPGYFAGIVGSGATRIDIYAPSGAVTVSALW